MFLFSHTTTTLIRSRIVQAALVAAAAVAIFIAMSDRAEAAETCTGPKCDTVAFVDTHAVFNLYRDLVPSSPIGRFYYGNPGDEPLMGDWNCDGEQTPGMYRRSTGHVYLRNSNTQGVADSQYIFGNPGDIPIVGDFNGNGCDTVSIYRPSEAKFYLSYKLGAPVADVSFHLGAFGDLPIVGDFNGDGVDTVGIFRPSTGLVAISNSRTTGEVHATYYFGGAGDQVIAGDWDGDGDDTIGLYRPSNGVLYLTNEHRGGAASYTMNVGKFHRAVSASGVTGVPSGVVGVPGIDKPPPRTASGQVRVSGRSNVVIENLHITNPSGPCVVVSGSSNVTIRNSTIGPCRDEGVYITDSSNVLVSRTYISEVNKGVLAHRSQSIRVNENVFVHTGRNFVQFDKVNGANSSVSSNRGTNQLGGSNAEDLISLYQSNGTPSSPIRVENNHIKNGGPSRSGTGILLGDAGGSHQIAEGNFLVDTGQVGIGVAGGHTMTVRNNSIYSSRHAWSNVGIYAWDVSAACGSVTITGNQVDWTAAGGYANGFWNGGGCNLNEYANNWRANLGTWIW